MSRLIPIVLAVVAIAALTLVEGSLSERWSENKLCAYCVSLLEGVPKQIGGWTGTDSKVDDETQEVAGARGYVSRGYKDDRGRAVGVWLIVGHARDTAHHVPTTCYAGSGFTGGSTKEPITLTLNDGTKADFFTALFTKETPLGEQQERVYWTWFDTKSGSGEPVQWRAPETLSWETASSPALFKLYFTSSGEAAKVAPADNVALDFAREFLPVVDRVLRPANGEIPADFDPASVGAE